MANDISANTNSLKELKKIKRIHFYLIHVPYGDTTQIIQLNTKQRAAHHILVTALVYKELDCSYYLLTLLHFIEENQCFPWNQWFFRESRQPQSQIFCPLLLTE